MKPLQVPSLDSSQLTLSTFFSNPDFRKLYNKLLDTLKQWKNLEALTWFLEQCLRHKVIPESFKSKAKPKNSSSKSSKDEWNQATLDHSLDLVKVALSDQRNAMNILMEDVQSKYNVLYALTPNDYVKEELEARFIHKGQTFQKHAMEVKVKKLEMDS